MFAPIIQRVVACDGTGLLRTAYTSPRRGIPLPRGSACAVSHDLDGLIPPGLCDLFQPLTSMGFGVPAPLGIPRIAPRCPSTGGGGVRVPGYPATVRRRHLFTRLDAPPKRLISSRLGSLRCPDAAPSTEVQGPAPVPCPSTSRNVCVPLVTSALPKVYVRVCVARPHRRPVMTRRPSRSCSPAKVTPLARCVPSRPGWLLVPVFRPLDRVLPPTRCRSHRGRVRRAPPEGESPSAPLRSRPRRLSTTRPLTSSGLL